MVTIDDLKESLRAQLATLIALYEAESSGPGTGLRERGVDAVRPDPSSNGPCDAIASKPVAIAIGRGDAERALAIESSLQDFSAAIDAAEAAAAAAATAYGRASGMLQRAADSRAVAMMMRRDAEKRLRDLALGRVVPTFEAHRLAEAQAAARMSAALSRQSEAEASAYCVRARDAAQCAAIALAAACRADPQRANATFDPAIAQAARADAQAAADRAGQLATSRGDPPSKSALPMKVSPPDAGREA